MLEAITDIQQFLRGKELADLEANRHDRLIVERNFEIVSEASRRLPEDLKARHTQIPWKKVAAIGNVLRHEYDNVDPEYLLVIARTELSDLEQVCKRELELLREKTDVRDPFTDALNAPPTPDEKAWLEARRKRQLENDKDNGRDI